MAWKNGQGKHIEESAVREEGCWEEGIFKEEWAFPEGWILDGRTQPVFDYGDSILERVFVETPVDTDGDGKLDLIAVYIRRPKETGKDLRVPAIYVANPYMMHCNEDWYALHSVNQELKEIEEQNLLREDIAYDFSKDVSSEPGFPRKTKGFADFSPVEEPDFEALSDVYSYFLCRGYAAVFCGGLGTRGSEGFTLTGSQEEILAFRSVIDWLCGRRRAFTNRTDNMERKADWCTGKVAMSGKSYLGTMCIGVAMTGVEGLETVIPEAAISNWYSYYRSSGLVTPAQKWQGDDLDLLARYCFSRAYDSEDYNQVKDAYQKKLDELVQGEDRESGSYNRFWEERNYLNQISHMKASALIIHGINDWNVKMNQCIPFWNALKVQGIPAKMLLHQGDHIYIYDLKDSPALELVHQWLDHYLWGLDNGVENIEEVWVQSHLNPSRWMRSDRFPPMGTKRRLFPIGKDTRVSRPGQRKEKVNVFCDDLQEAGYDRERDNQEQWLDNLVLPEREGRPWCLKYVWDPFEDGQPGEGKDRLRISGEISVDMTCSLNRGTGILSAMLVEYGEEKRLTVKLAAAGTEKRSWGPGAPEYEELAFQREEKPSSYRVISRGHRNAQNQTNCWNKCKVIPGEQYRYRLSMIPTDYTVERGKRLGLILYGSDAEETLRPLTATEVTVIEEGLIIEIPML